jgi:hypothetical protein
VPEPADIADLGHDHRGQHRADTRQLLDRGVPLMPGQQVAQHLLQQPDLGGEPASQLPQRGDLARVRLGQLELVEPGLPVHAEQVRMGDRDAELGQHRVHLVLDRGTRLDQPVPVAGQLPQLADLRRRDPRLRQSAHPQQVRQIRGVPQVFSELTHPF